MTQDTAAPDGLLKRQISRRSMLAGTVASLVAPTALGLGAAPAAAHGNGNGNHGKPDKDKGKPDKNKVRRLTMYAEALPGGLVGYGLEPGKATVPGPTLEMWEGETFEITLVNTTDKRLSLHAHGVSYSHDSDGSPLNASFNEPGQSRTYVWRTHAAYTTKGGQWMPGSAGYWHYHDHALGTDHGTEGVKVGMYGALIVRRKGDVLPDRQYTVAFNGMSINNQVAPNVPVFEANEGERVEFVAIGHGNAFHTFHLHAHRWANNRTGYLTGPNDPTQVIDTRDLNPGDSFGFQVIAGEKVGPGAWMVHCHVQSHSDMGMGGIFLVANKDGSVPEHAQAALHRYQGHAHP
ncbi:multicopper oxidase domain-containing protein [Oerskovia enterophila]